MNYDEEMIWINELKIYNKMLLHFYHNFNFYGSIS